MHTLIYRIFIVRILFKSHLNTILVLHVVSNNKISSFFFKKLTKFKLLAIAYINLNFNRLKTLYSFSDILIILIK